MGSLVRWENGYFTNDGFVELSDFNILAANFGLSAGADGIVYPQDWANLAAAVPEPCDLAALCLLEIVACPRRNRAM
jgi:hypothetical protein